jgi:uncharacterized membrane protein YjgN (DUF898 family)
MDNIFRDFYKLIEVSREARRDTIEQACLRLAERFRPEKNPGDLFAAKAFADIEAAYVTLTDSAKRAAYDSEFPFAGATVAEDADRRYPIQFTASAAEYFRIWIVNLALTIVTLGIYSAWAKVRRKRYFYGHTRIDGEGFEYRANPVAILKGRGIALGLFGVYSLSAHFSPVLKAVFGIAVPFAMPWFLTRSLAFNAYNSAYRNVRFHFRGTYREALKLMFVIGLLMIVTLGLAYPYAKARLARFAAGRHRYGAAEVALGPLTKAFYGVYCRLAGMLLLAGIVPILIVVFAGAAGMRVQPSAATLEGLRSILSGGSGYFVVAFSYFFYLSIFSYLQARTTNLVWRNLSIGQAVTSNHAPTTRVRFECHLRARDLTWLYAVNILAIIFTLGLATPWAVVRSLRYRMECMAVLVAGSLDAFVAAKATNVGATGEAVGEMVNFDFGL